MMKAPTTKECRGFIVPVDDEVCYTAATDEVHELEKVWPYIKAWDTCVQAGGNLGVFPRTLAAKFHSVYTFEPDAENFYCLGINCPESNVIKLQAALGDKPGLVSIVDENQGQCNPGAKYVRGKGLVPTLRIDDLGLESCDLILLDIEGSELAALKGAQVTITKFKPVIAIEDKEPCYAKFGTKEGETEGWLIDNFGYKIIARYGRDILLSC